MPNGRISTGMVSEKKDHQTSSSFDYAANSVPTSADTGADSTLILLIERNIEKCKIPTAFPLFTHIKFNHQQTGSVSNLGNAVRDRNLSFR